MLGTAASAGAVHAAGAAGVRVPAYTPASARVALVSVVRASVIPASAQAPVLVQAVMARAPVVTAQALAVMAQARVVMVLAVTVRVVTIIDDDTPASLSIRSAVAAETIR